MKQMLKGVSDKISETTDKYGLANPIEVINQEFGGETREESKARRAKQKSGNVMLEGAGEGVVKKAKGGTASSRADGCAVRGKTRGKIV
jgi:hypothetical protein